MTNPMNMLPNDHHPGPRCSCAECLRKYPDDSPSVIGPRAPMPTVEEYRAAHKCEYVRLFVEVGVPEEVAADWHDENWDDIKDGTPQQAFNDEVSYWEADRIAELERENTAISHLLTAQGLHIKDLEQALRKIAAFNPGEFRPLTDEIEIWRIASTALGQGSDS